GGRGQVRGGPAEGGAEAGPSRAASRVVPTPGESARNDSGCAEAALSTRDSSVGRRAGRSADSAHTPNSGSRLNATDAPCSSAGFSPVPGSPPTTTAPNSTRAAPARGSSVTTNTVATSGQVRAAATVSQAKARASSVR